MRGWMVPVAALAVAMVAGMAMADPAEGVWQTQPGDDGGFGHVRIAPCGPVLCGTLTTAFDGTGRAQTTDNVGRQIVWDMAAEGSGAYGKGKIFAPDSGKTYNGKMELDGDRLKVSGCVMGICRGQTWARVE